MLVFMRRCEPNTAQNLPKILRTQAPNLRFLKNDHKREIQSDDDFRVFDLRQNKHTEQPKQQKKETPAGKPRVDSMSVDQDWPTIWPGIRSFHPASVPLPIRQGLKFKKQPSPGKYANFELLKVPNFLHLTPPAVKRHCEALKKFCTEWPKELESEEVCQKYFPVQITTADYCYSSPSIREPLARIVTLQVKLSSLHLDYHARDKMLRLLGDRYNPETDLITIVADRCPVKKQNLDYAKYLLTAVFHESWRVEDWEAEKSEADMEVYDWDTSKSRQNLVTMYAWPAVPQDLDYTNIPHATDFKLIVSDLVNNGESLSVLENYKEAVKKIFNLSNDNQV